MCFHAAINFHQEPELFEIDSHDPILKFQSSTRYYTLFPKSSSLSAAELGQKVSSFESLILNPLVFSAAKISCLPLVETVALLSQMNRLQRLLLSVPRLSQPIIHPSCFLHRRAFSTSDTDAVNKSRSSTLSSLNENELAKFSAISDTWWHSDGPFKPLHQMNPTRLAFIRSTLCRHFSKDPSSVRPFEGLRLIDVGCGGGILSEPLARMGATVTGIDAVDKNVKIARLHADMDPVTSTIEYHCITAEKLVDEGRMFDAVLSLEVIEHVANPAEFCNSLAALTIPNGATIVSTVNRTLRAYVSNIVLAEYILRWLPKGTHQWSSFVTPEELTMVLKHASVDVKEIAGFVYDPITGKWLLSDDISVNFIAYGTKRNDLGDI